MLCPLCGSEPKPGFVLYIGPVWWSKGRSPGFVRHQRALPFPWFVDLATFLGRPWQVAAWRCGACDVAIALPNGPACTHELEKGWVFPLNGLWWVSGSESWQPRLWYPFSLTGRDGRIAVPLVPPRFTVSRAGTRAPATHCGRCGLLVVPFPGKGASG